MSNNTATIPASTKRVQGVNSFIIRKIVGNGNKGNRFLVQSGLRLHRLLNLLIAKGEQTLDTVEMILADVAR